MWTFIGLFAAPFFFLLAFIIWNVVREAMENGLSAGTFRRALLHGREDPTLASKDRFGCLLVSIGGLFFFTGYWISLFSLFASAYTLFFIGIVVLVVGMVVALRPILGG